MKDIFNDPDFDKFLYGGIKDLEEPVGRLVYNLYKAKIETSWSCAGHIGKFIRGSEKNATVGNYAYDCGRLYYQEENDKSLILTDKLKNIVTSNNFANIIRRNDNSMEFNLDMGDIASNCSVKGYSPLQVPIAQAEERYKQFLNIWAELTDWSEEALK